MLKITFGNWGLLQKKHLVPNNRIYYLKLSPTEVMKFIVSGGVTRFENLEIDKLNKESQFHAE